MSGVRFRDEPEAREEENRAATSETIQPRVLHFLKHDRYEPGDHWKQFIQTRGYTAELAREPEPAELSDADREFLDDVFREHAPGGTRGHKDVWELIHWMHDNVREWDDPGESATPIESLG